MGKNHIALPPVWGQGRCLGRAGLSCPVAPLDRRCYFCHSKL